MRGTSSILVLVFALCGAGYGSEWYRGGVAEYDDYMSKYDGTQCNYGEERADMYKCDDSGECDYDNEKYYYEPCDYADAINCVRKFFAIYGQCSVIRHADKMPVYRERNVYYVPNINLTCIATGTQTTGLDGKIEKFYLNKKTDNLVMSVNFKGLQLNIKSLTFIVSRRGREPAVASDMANVTVPITLTAVIPFEGGITLKTLKQSRVTVFLDSSNVRFDLGPKVSLSKDPAISATIAGLLANISTTFQEILLTEGPISFLAYLQKYICDYGIPQVFNPDIQSIYPS